LCKTAGLSMDEAQVALAALNALRGPTALTGVRTLVAVLDRHQLFTEASVVDDWATHTLRRS
jgi:hypothetical protein